MTRRSDRFASPADRREHGRGCGRLDGGDHAEGSLEQGASDRSETPAKTEGRLGDSGSASAGAQGARSRSVQPRHRQQAERLRPRGARSDDVCAGGRVRDRATIIQKKTGRPVQFEITEQTRKSIQDWLPKVDARKANYLFPSRFRAQPHLSTRQYARIVHAWVESTGLDSSAYGTHSMRRTKAAQIYKKTGNLRAVQLLLGHTKLESTVRYLGIEVDDALTISEQVEL